MEIVGYILLALWLIFALASFLFAFNTVVDSKPKPTAPYVAFTLLGPLVIPFIIPAWLFAAYLIMEIMEVLV